MPRFFVNKNDIIGGCVSITGEDFVHIVKVQRNKVGDMIMLCDGEGMDYNGIIHSISKSEAIIKLMGGHLNQTEPKVSVTVFQGVPKQGKMESIIQKAVELGANRIVPVQTHRCVVKLPADDFKKQERWQRVALEAAKQCGRGRVPIVEQVIDVKQAIERLSKIQCPIMPYEEEQTVRLEDVLTCDSTEYGIFIGPEGGFEPVEIELAAKKGIKPVTLGKRILRTETVAAAILPIIMYRKDW